MHQAERSFVKLGLAKGGHGPFRGLDAPFALILTVKQFQSRSQCIFDTSCKGHNV
jgi:hypothetical protein